MKMSIEELKLKLADILEVDENTLSVDTVLKDLDQWDSFAVLSVVALITEYTGKQVVAKDIEQISTMNDLLFIFGDAKKCA